jgi:serine/threonine-protein kinase
VSATTGVLVPLADAGVNGGAAWGPDDTIVYVGTNRRGLMEIPAGGGAPREVMPGDPAALIRNPAFLPGGGALLVTTSPTGAATAEESSIEIVRVRTGQRKVLVRGGNVGNYLPTGHLVFQRNGTIAAARLDLERQELTSAAGVVVEGIRQPFNGVGAFSCSRSGTCVYAAGESLMQRTVTLVDRSGTSRPLQLPARNYGQPRFSPKGDRLVFWLQQIRCDIEVYDLARGATTRLTDEGDNHFPIWTPDGQQVVYISRKRDATGYELFSRPANGGPEERLSTVALDLDAVSPIALSPDGRTVAFSHRGDIWVISPPNSAEPKPFVQSRFKETMPAFSPDGRWLAYVGDESGRSEVYVQPFPGPGGKYPVSVDGGTEPVWARNGRALFFRNGDQVMAADVTTQPVFSASHPRVLFSGPFARQDTHVNYDVSPDGERFVMLNSGAQERAATEITVLLNWFEELQRLVPGK